jgi:hypothetical protein
VFARGVGECGGLQVGGRVQIKGPSTREPDESLLPMERLRAAFEIWLFEAVESVEDPEL